MKIEIQTNTNTNDWGLGEQLVETRSLQAAYQAEARIFFESLERECRDIHADYSRVLTTEPVDLALRSTLLERSRGG